MRRQRLICWGLALCVLCYWLSFVFAEWRGAYADSERPPETGEDAGNPEIQKLTVVLNSGESDTIRAYLLSSGSSGQPEEIFTDVVRDKSGKKPYYYDAVYWAVRYGITTGTTKTTFSPDAPCKRGHIVTFIWRGCGEPYDNDWIYPFADEGLEKSPFGKPAAWAYRRDTDTKQKSPKLENGVFDANGKLLFKPDEPCNRGEAVIYLWKAANCPDADIEKARVFTDIDVDDNSDDSYLRELPKAVAWAMENGITEGRTPTTFSPKETTTRGNIVTFLYRFAQTPDGKRTLKLD